MKVAFTKDEANTVCSLLSHLERKMPDRDSKRQMSRLADKFYSVGPKVDLKQHEAVFLVNTIGKAIEMGEGKAQPEVLDLLKLASASIKQRLQEELDAAKLS